VTLSNLHTHTNTPSDDSGIPPPNINSTYILTLYAQKLSKSIVTATLYMMAKYGKQFKHPPQQD
jgi:hypothetical protein